MIPGQAHAAALAADGLPADGVALAAILPALIAEVRRDMSRLAAETPKVLDGHSDGKRVRYVRMETRAAVLAEVLAMLEEAS